MFLRSGLLFNPDYGKMLGSITKHLRKRHNIDKWSA
jgi:hypothetical protein